jgi:photosystem II Psb27 protein
MKRFLSRQLAQAVARVVALVLVLGLSWVSFAAPAEAKVNLTGKYDQDIRVTLETLRNAVQLADTAPEQGATRAESRQLINDFFSRYRRYGTSNKSASFTTMWTAMNSLAGHYSAYPNRPIPQKMKDRLEVEFKQAELAANRGD